MLRLATFAHYIVQVIHLPADIASGFAARNNIKIIGFAYVASSNFRPLYCAEIAQPTLNGGGGGHGGRH